MERQLNAVKTAVGKNAKALRSLRGDSTRYINCWFENADTNAAYANIGVTPGDISTTFEGIASWAEFFELGTTSGNVVYWKAKEDMQLQLTFWHISGTTADGDNVFARYDLVDRQENILANYECHHVVAADTGSVSAVVNYSGYLSKGKGIAFWYVAQNAAADSDLLWKCTIQPAREMREV